MDFFLCFAQYLLLGVMNERASSNKFNCVKDMIYRPRGRAYGFARSACRFDRVDPLFNRMSHYLEIIWARSINLPSLGFFFFSFTNLHMLYFETVDK